MADQGGSHGGDTVAVLGAGSTMGLAMARNMLGAGIEVRAWNRTQEKAQPLADDGAEVLGSPEEAARGAGMLLTMLSDADAVLESAALALPALAGGGLWLQMSTIGERGIDRCIELARQHGVDLLDAPVLGTKQPAERGELVVLASGPQRLQDRARPIFDAIGQKTMWIGQAGSGTRLKLVTNSWVLTVTEGAAETIALAEGLGLDPALLFEAIDGSALDLPYLRMKGNAMIERTFEPAFSLGLAAKDARLVDEAARRADLDLPVLGAIARRMTEGAEQHGDKDMSAIYLTAIGRG
jgi:3-hydroxyisobutyrate dehydrogenase